jgi:hypothetical protein
VGGARASARTARLAAALGRAIAREGWVLLNGGRDAGVMAASSRGASEAGGLVVGILPGRDRAGAASGVSVAVVTGIGDARNAILALTSDVVVALPGGAGTLSEIALARKSGKPVVLLGWAERSLLELDDGLIRAAGVEDAISAARASLRRSLRRQYSR